MPRSLKSKNPFYALLVIAGITFALTATAYCVMAVRDARAPAATEASTTPAVPHPLVTWMRNHGQAALLTELALLAVFVVGAIGTDNYWQRRATNRR